MAAVTPHTGPAETLPPAETLLLVALEEDREASVQQEAVPEA